MPSISGSWSRGDIVLVNPAKLAWGLLAACEKLGVRIFEQSKVTDIEEDGGKIVAKTAAGQVVASKVALATNVFPSLLKRNALMTVPVYDYVLVTEPLTEEQREAIGWDTLHGLVDLNNRFHYSRPIVDENGGFRILYGGFDAIYRFGGKVNPEFYDSETTYTEACRALLRHLPGTAGPEVLARLGRGHRLLQPLLLLLRPGLQGQGRLLRRLHRPGRRRLALRRQGHAGPARGQEQRAHQP